MPSTPTPYVYPIRDLITVYDGDTMRVIIDLGFSTLRVVTLRLAGLDTPEVTGAQKKVGLQVREVVRAWMRNCGPHTVESTSLDKYGRCLAIVHGKRNGKPETLNDLLLTNNLANGYAGTGLRSWSNAALAEADGNARLLLAKLA